MKEIKRNSKGQFLKGIERLDMANEKNPNWKGDDVGYTALHDWLYIKLGKPNLCEECGTTKAKKYEWANISGEYKRDISDYKRLCTSCHRLLDGHAKKMWETRRSYA